MSLRALTTPMRHDQGFQSYITVRYRVCTLPIGTTFTIFIRIVATATINFSLAGVRLLIEGGSYSRKAFIYLEKYLCADPVVSSYDRLVFRTTFRIFEIL